MKKLILTIIMVIIAMSISSLINEKDLLAKTSSIDFDFTSADSIKGFDVKNGNLTWKDGEVRYTLNGDKSCLTTCQINVPKGTRYSALLSVRNTVVIRLKNSTESTKIKLSFITSSDGTYDDEKSKEFDVKAQSDYLTYYFNLSDIKGAKDYLRGIRIEPLGADSGDIYIKSISFERENKIIEYAGSIDSCITDGKVITIKGTVGNEYNGKTVTIYESPVYNYTQSISGLTKLSETTVKDGKFVVEIPYMNENVTRLSTLFIAAINKIPVAPWFCVENYTDFMKNPYEFSLKATEVSVTEERFGAKGDSYTNDNIAIQKAIDYVSEHGGGRVVIPGDRTNPYGRRYIITNIKMKNNVELHIEEGAVLWQSPRISDYAYKVALGHDVNLPGINWAHAASCHNLPMIQGDQVSNVKITGKGIIRSSDIGSENLDGVSYNSLVVNCDNTIHLVPIGFYKCTGVEIRDVTLKRTNNYHINMRACKNVYIANVFMDEVGCVGGDGISATVGTKNMIIDRCFLYTNDDAVTICSTYNDPRGLSWWFAQPNGDNCIDNLIVRHCNLYGGHGITFITWGTDNPDLSKQEIKNITVYDNILNGGVSSIGSWGDNPYYGGPFNGLETDDYSPVKCVRFYDNIYMKDTDISPVKGTDIITDCGMHSSKDFLYGGFERTNSEKGWITGLSNWQYDKDTDVGTVKRSTVEKGKSGYVGFIKSKGRLYQGLYMVEGQHVFSAEVYLKTKSQARLFVIDSLSGKLIAEKKIKSSKSFKNVSLSFECDTKIDCYIGIELLNDGIAYIDNCKVTSQIIEYPQYFIVDFDENSFDCFEYPRWKKINKDNNTYISLPSYVSGVFKIQPNYVYKDCEISCSIMLNSVNSKIDANFGFSLRRNNGGNDQYDIHYNPITKTINIRRYENGSQTTLYSKSFAMKTDEWYSLKVIIEGGKIDLFINNELLKSVIDESPLPEGEAFICTYNSAISIDDIKFAKIGGGIDEDWRKNIGKNTDVPGKTIALQKNNIGMTIITVVMAVLALSIVGYVILTVKKERNK
ncbi:MAG: glycosyl hydrolase family 28 protein [Clostridia bacterium]|jgi:hypothetical protein